ncbi:hypothetical protein Hanom_Chr02g00175471 [Helianthus anomalus]
MWRVTIKHRLVTSTRVNHVFPYVPTTPNHIFIAPITNTHHLILLWLLVVWFNLWRTRQFVIHNRFGFVWLSILISVYMLDLAKETIVERVRQLI